VIAKCLVLLLVYYSSYVYGFLLGTQIHRESFADKWLKYAETNKCHYKFECHEQLQLQSSRYVFQLNKFLEKSI